MSKYLYRLAHLAFRPGWRQNDSDLPEPIGLIIAFIVLMVVFDASPAPISPVTQGS
jgi:hypothetical protein